MRYLRSSIFVLICLLAGLMVAPRTVTGKEFSIPSVGDWQDFGIIFTAGGQGEWDLFLAGGFAGSAVKRRGIYYLYYQGASGYREIDESVTGRAIGVAISEDGINFIKYAGNPVISWQPNGNGEEGAVSAAAYRDHRKKIVLYYGANTEESPTTVNADARLAISRNGLNFQNKGRVLNHRSSKLWGSGDEIFPVVAFQAEDRSAYVYYIPNGTPQSRQLGVAWGPGRKKLNSSAAVRSEGGQVGAWGMGGSAKVDATRFALFLNDVQKSRMEVRLVSPANPTRLSQPIERYKFADFRQGTVLLDRKKRTWFMYYRNQDQDAYGVKLAPAGPPDSSGPLAPASLRVVRDTPGDVRLSWDAARDPETGVAIYRIYRNGQLLGATTRWSFRDDTAPSSGTLSYEIEAVNLHGTEAPNRATIDIEASRIPLTSPRR